MKKRVLTAHIGQGCQTVGVEVLVSRAQHVELDGPYNDQDKETTDCDLGDWTLRIPGYVLKDLK